MRIEEKIIQLRNQIDRAEQERVSACAELNVLEKQLQDEFGVSSLQEAVKLLERLQKKLDSLNEEIENKIKQIMEMMNVH